MSDVKDNTKPKLKKAKAGSDDLPLYFRGLISANTFSADKNTIEVVFATEEPVLQRDYWNDEVFYEVLSLDPKHVRIDRINGSGPVLDQHRARWGSKSDSVGDLQIGVVETAVAKGKEGVATLRFSKRDSIKDLVADIQDGIIKNVSTGYRVYKYEDISQPGDTRRTLRAIDWEPLEISFVTIPADAKSKTRSLKNIAAVVPVIENPAVAENNENLNNENTRANKMDDETVVTPAAPAAAPVAAPAAAAPVAVGKRNAEIRTLVRMAGLEASVADGYIDTETPVDQVRIAVTEAWEKKQMPAPAAVPTSPIVSVGEDRDAKGRLRGFEEAIAVRTIGIGAYSKTGPETEYGKQAANGRRISLMDHGIRSLEAKGVKTAHLNENEIFERSMASGDFPIALANVMNKELNQRYEQAEPVWRKFAKQVDAKDFKPLFSVTVDGETKPGKITEKGGYPYVQFKEAGDSFKLDTYGLITGITRQLFISDDLGAFGAFGEFFSDGMIENQTEIVYGALLGDDNLGRVLGEDNVKLFDKVKHNNYFGGALASAPSIEAIDKMVTAMRRQKTLAGRRMRGNRPDFMVVPPELAMVAYSIVNGTYVPNDVTKVNMFKGAFEVLVEDFFENTQAWFLATSPGRIPVVKYATLDGQAGIYTKQWFDETDDTWKFKGRNDFSATADNYRGITQNEGVEAEE